MVEFLLAILTLFASQAQALDRRVPIHICHAQQLVLKIKTVETLQKTDQFNAAGHYAGTMKNLTTALKTQLRYSLNSQVEPALEPIYVQDREQTKTNAMGGSSQLLDHSGLGDTSLQLTSSVGH